MPRNYICTRWDGKFTLRIVYHKMFSWEYWSLWPQAAVRNDTEKSPTLYPTSPMVIFCRTTRMLALMQSTPILFRFQFHWSLCACVKDKQFPCPLCRFGYPPLQSNQPPTVQTQKVSFMVPFYNHTHLPVLLTYPKPLSSKDNDKKWNKMLITWRMSHKRNCTSALSIPSWFDLLPSVSFPWRFI